jgi:uncharacterized damage-inducible protein DinB
MKQLGMLFSLAAFFLCAVAQDKPMEMPKGIKGSYVRQAAFVQGQIMSLVDAFSNEQLAYRPMEGVRSTSEHFYHVNEGNYLSMKVAGFELPQGIDLQTIEKGPVDKESIRASLKKSFDFAADCIGKIPESEYDAPVDFFGNKMTKLDMIILAIYHQHEILGELISYARVNKVVPPWTAARQKRVQEQQKK